MSERRFPNESKEYRAARDALLKDERELIDKVKSVAAKRRELPPGGELKEDYVFEMGHRRESRDKASSSPNCSAIKIRCCFTHSCSGQTGTSLVHPARRLSMPSIAPGIRFRAMPHSPPSPRRRLNEINEWAKERGWSQIALVSGAKSPFQADYKC